MVSRGSHSGRTSSVTELDKKVDQLPTKKELADALRAFADELDRGGAHATPQPDPS
ncbi:hypothetical protein GCM10017687_64990 [Streptomyces echinatus]